MCGFRWGGGGGCWENENLGNLYNKVMGNMYWIFFFGNNNYGFVYEFSGFIV